METKTGIPMQTLIDMADILYRGAREAFKDPAFQKAYEQWAEERRQKENGGVQGSPHRRSCRGGDIPTADFISCEAGPEGASDPVPETIVHVQPSGS